MPRPVKWRKVDYIPVNRHYVPCSNINSCRFIDIEEVQIKIEEIEALRLKDIEGFSQEECANKMEVSRQTFQNILEEARRKVATALIEGNAITIGGGHYTKNVCRLRCLDCGKEQEASLEENAKECKFCKSKEILCSKRMNCKIGCKL